MDILKYEDRIVGSKYGIISDIYNADDVFGFPHIYRVIANVEMENISKYYDINGYGYAFDENDARRKAIGEALERYAGAIKVKGELKKSFSDIDGIERVSGELSNFFLSRLYLSHDMYEKCIEWTTCEKIYNGEKYMFPVFWINYPCYEEEKDYSSLGSTSGMAAAMTKEKAIDNSISECLERNICAEFWLGKVSIYELDMVQLDYINKSIINNYINCGMKIELYYIDNIWRVPCYAAKITNIDMNRFPNRPLNYMVAKVGRGDNLHIYALLGELIGGYYSLYELYQKEKHLDWTKESISIRNALYFAKNKIDIKVSGKKDLVISNTSVTNLAIENCLPIYLKNITPSDLKNIGVYVYKAISAKLLRMHDGYLYGEGVIEYEREYPFI